MADTIDRPTKDDGVRAEWGAKVADMLNRHESALDAGSARPGANLRERRAAPFPYECRVVTSGDSAALAVFAPQGVLTIDASAVGIDTATAVQGMEAGWYTFDGVEVPEAGESSEVWLRVEFPEESESDSESESEPESPSEPTAELVADDGSGDGEDDEGNVQKVLIARVTAHSGGGYRVEQFIRSSLHLATPSATPPAGVTSLNELTGDVTIEGGDGVEVEEEGQTIRISLTGDEEDADGYCNAISGDFGGGGGGGHQITGGGGNWISHESGGGDDDFGNDISNWPCDSGVDEGETT